jgi:hypothetical protein
VRTPKDGAINVIDPRANGVMRVNRLAGIASEAIRT